jgi:dihydroorotase
MQESYLITNARIVNEGEIFDGSVWIENGRIKEIFRGADPRIHASVLECMNVMDAAGLWLLPGVIDDQVHFRDPGLTHKGDLFTESRAAVAGGVTSFMDMPNTTPKATTIDLLEMKYNMAAGKSLANYSFFLGATNNNLEEILKADPSKICGLKVFMGASTGNMLVDDPATLEAIFEKSPLRIAVHAEEEPIVRANLEKAKQEFGEDIPVAMHPTIRSAEACFVSSEKAVNLARKHGSRLHLLHLSTEKEMKLLDNSIPLKEKKITGEVCVHHLLFDHRDYASRGSLIKWNPAIKDESDKNALFHAVLDDTIDIIATDHAPHTMEEKQKPYLECPSGAPLVQHSLVVMLEFVHQGKITIGKVVEKMCHGPAILYGIKERGFIRKRYRADLVLVDPDDPWTVEPANVLYKCGWSPLDGMQFRSKVLATFVNGKRVFFSGVFDESVRGERLEFEL